MDGFFIFADTPKDEFSEVNHVISREAGLFGLGDWVSIEMYLESMPEGLTSAGVCVWVRSRQRDLSCRM